MNTARAAISALGLLTATAAHAQLAPPAATYLASAQQGGSVTPVLIQQVTSSANPVGVGIVGKNFKIPWPNAIQAGDTLICGFTYPHAQAGITVTDSLKNVWGNAVVVADAGVGNYVAALYVAPNSPGGTDLITFGSTGTFLPFQYSCYEFSNISPVAPVTGTSSLAGTVGATLTLPSFTPAPNNAGGGNVIINYTALAGGAGANPTSWVAGSGFTLLDADIAWITNQGFPHASMWSLQTTSASITPAITATADTTNGYNSVAVSLRVASSGGALPSGIYVRKVVHQTNNLFSANATWNLQMPFTGNLRAFESSLGASLNGATIVSITDSDGNTWSAANTNKMIWYATGTTADPNAVVTLVFGGGIAAPTNTIRFFDILNGTAFDASNINNISCNSATTLTGVPTLTPTHAPGLVIAGVAVGQGPGLSVTSPTGAIFDLVTYTGEQDTDLMENADLAAHVYNATTTAQSWNWTLTSVASNSCSGEAAAFH